MNGQLPSRPSSSDSWPAETKNVWRIVELCWKPVPGRPRIHELIGELGRVGGTRRASLEYEESHSHESFDRISRAPSGLDTGTSATGVDL